MMKYNQDEYLERQFKKSILTFAADPLEQVISEIPGCITCDMAEEFDSYRTLYFVEQWSRFTTEQVDIINQIDHILSEYSGEAFQCLFFQSVDEIDMSMISEVLGSEEWVTVRKLARRFIRSMKWESENLGRYVHQGNNIWKKTDD